MHSFLPDTARAKSQGVHEFFSTLSAAGTVLAGSLLFGIGMVALWLLSAAIVLTQRRIRLLPSLAANALFPFVLVASALRGQAIQGVRYLIWSLFFSVLWNLFELWHIDSPGRSVAPARVRRPLGVTALAAFLGCCLLALPIDSRLMYRVLTTRARTMKLFMSQDLATSLHGELGVAGDVGYISYFSKAPICDLSGLVNGPAAARLTPQQRASRCAADHPGFALFNAGQAAGYMQYQNLTGWQVCGQYDFGNMRQPDRHFLLVQPQTVPAVCGATGYTPGPISIALVDTRYP
jgi:hypothetical protein